jgi:hypothetical protein
MRSAAILCILVCAAALPVHAQAPRPSDHPFLEATVGNDVLQLRWLRPFPSTKAKGDLDYGLLLSNNRDIIGTAALMYRTELHILPNFTLQIGPQGYVALLAEGNKSDVLAVALGANARYDIVSRWGLSLFGSAFYSPAVLTFGAGDNIYDFLAGAEIGISPRLGLVGGYRWLKLTITAQPTERVSNELFVGLRWQMD